MRKVMRPRYYCDFCKKSGASASHMAQHEKACTMNPDRECRMCKFLGFEQKPITALIGAASAGLAALREAADHCPVCILATIRQGKLNPNYSTDEGAIANEFGEFDFKSEAKTMLDDHAAYLAEQSYY